MIKHEVAVVGETFAFLALVGLLEKVVLVKGVV